MAYGSGAPLLVRATIDARKLYGVLRTWKEEGNSIGRTYSIPVVLFPTEITGQCEAAFLQRIKPNHEAA